jgi:para-nitrobenzyl esterase
VWGIVGHTEYPFLVLARRFDCPVRTRRLPTLLAPLSALVLVAGCAHGDGPADHAGSGGASTADVVQTKSGAVRGVVAPDYRVFMGIPYAAPPVGTQRWQPPRPAGQWTGIRDATEPGLRCIQDTRLDPDYGLATSEDCLNLNVWTPVADSASPRAVMVWIHGGGFLNGSADIYDARWLTSQGDIIVVTINYRLGALGFLAQPEMGPGLAQPELGPGLAQPGLAPGAGNYGLLDQQEALRWVRENIASFGGDPNRVTIAGESAGAMSVCDHLAAPGSVGLFSAAIMQSGPCQAQADRRLAEDVSKKYAASMGCSDEPAAAHCLRELPASRLEQPLRYVGFGDDRLPGPVTGTEVIPVDPMTVASAGKAAAVPVLIGTNSDEYTLFVAMQYLEKVSLPPFEQLLGNTFGPAAAAVATEYAPDEFGGEAGLAYAAAVTDSVFACPSDQLTAGLTRSGPVYAYEFSDRTAPAPEPMRRAPFPIGAGHALELRYLFDIGGAPPLNPEQRVLSTQMIQYWSQFVKTGAPATSGQPVWPQFGAGQRLILQTGTLPVSTDFAARHRCAFWAAHPVPR